MANPNLAVSRISLSNVTDLVHSKSGAAGTANFDGGAPDGAISTVSPGRIVWASGDHQGLIDPAGLGITQPLRILRLSLFMAGQATWRIDILDGSDMGKVAEGTTETFFSDEALTFLTNSQKLKVTTTGGATTSVKMVCTVVDSYVFSPAPKGA